MDDPFEGLPEKLAGLAKFADSINDPPRRYMIHMGTELCLLHTGTGETLPEALMNLLNEIVKNGDEEDVLDISIGLQALQVTAVKMEEKMPADTILAVIKSLKEDS